jgi:hypothetical protein
MVQRLGHAPDDRQAEAEPRLLPLPLSAVPAAAAPPAPVATRLSGAHVVVVENDASTA